MAHKERINPKSGIKEYKVRYYFMKEGKKRDSETGWFTTLAAAEKEAAAQKERKEKEDRNQVLVRRDKKLLTAFDEFIEWLEEEKKTAITNTKATYLNSAKTIKKLHFPKELITIKINELAPFHFRRWLTYINNKDLSGNTVRNYKALLAAFNVWLANNDYYLEDDKEDLISVALSKTKIKSKTVGNKELKGQRNFISLLDFQNITEYYFSGGLADFRSFYYYTLFHVLFFSGMRVEELVALQWKFIDLRESKKLIYVKNAISYVEDNEKALERVKKGIYRTKNRTSIRKIPIFDFYYELLLDYKESYKYEFELTDEELEEAFVFPNVVKHNPNKFLISNTLLKELNKVCKAADIAKTDLQMFRHSCAYFLILPPPDGLGYTEERVKDYFGHTDTSMLTNIYARLNTTQKADRMKELFKDIHTAAATDEQSAEEAAKLELIRRIKGDNERAAACRQIRVFAQIERAISVGRQSYYYKPKDKAIIEAYKAQKGGDAKIEFIED